MLGWQTEILMVSRAGSEAGGQTHTNRAGGVDAHSLKPQGYDIGVCLFIFVLFICVRSVSLSVADNSEPQYACDRTECRPLLTCQPWILSDTQPGNTRSILFLSLRGCVWSMFGRKLSAPAAPLRKMPSLPRGPVFDGGTKERWYLGCSRHRAKNSHFVAVWTSEAQVWPANRRMDVFQLRNCCRHATAPSPSVFPLASLHDLLCISAWNSSFIQQDH